jgi:hypothetical protein
MSTDHLKRMSGWRRLAPLLWAGYGAVYVVVFLIRGEVLPAAITAVLVTAVGLGLAWELRRPQAGRPQQLGWRQDERQELIHRRAMTLVGHVAVAGAAVAALVVFAAGGDAGIWPILILAGLSTVYGAGLRFYQRRS